MLPPCCSTSHTHATCSCVKPKVGGIAAMVVRASRVLFLTQSTPMARYDFTYIHTFTQVTQVFELVFPRAKLDSCGVSEKCMTNGTSKNLLIVTSIAMRKSGSFYPSGNYMTEANKECR